MFVSEIPLLVMLFYLFHYVESSGILFTLVLVFKRGLFLVIYVEDNVRWGVWLGRHIC